MTGRGFEAGDGVTVVGVSEGYKRRPEYAEGARGVVEGVHGEYRPPDGGDPEVLYSVRFDPADLWDDPEGNAAVYVDLWESALSAAGGTVGTDERDEDEPERSQP